MLTALLPLFLVLSPKTSFSFDDGRFPVRPQQNAAHDRASTPSDRPANRDEFVLNPTGVAVAWYDSSALNILGSSNAVALEHNSPPNKAANENTSYSTLGVTSATPECGPSAFQPSEIEAVVATAAEHHGVDPTFAKAIAWTESRFDQKRNSPKGARGPMQLMPGTAQDLGVTDSCDSIANIDGGVRYLKALLAEFGNPLLAAAAYNAGAKAVYDNGGIPPYPETVRYVSTVLNRQLGLAPLAAKRNGKGRVVADQIASTKNDSTRVLGAKGGRFVNGVMHF